MMSTNPEVSMPIQVCLFQFADESPSRLLEQVAELGERWLANAGNTVIKEFSQYFTSPKIATFMASRFCVENKTRVRVLDPGSGVGILGIAAAQYLLARGVEHVELVAVEKEPGVRDYLSRAIAFAKEQLGERFDGTIVAEDVLELMASKGIGRFDFVISNPPYGKISPKNKQGSDAPNIYARFMEVTARLLKHGGQQCYIVPRSFGSGYYFRTFRRRFHAEMALESVHVFDSRTDPFKSQDVLQENVIVLYRRGKPSANDVQVSVSEGAFDLDQRTEMKIAREYVFHGHDPSAMLHVPTCEEDVQLMQMMHTWPCTLSDYGLEISTGPVVAFRSRPDWVQHTSDGNTVPLLWMNHVNVGAIRWPIEKGFRKEQYLRADAPNSLTVPNETFVLLRRFSAREDERRLTAAVLQGGSLPGNVIGLENHLNYIHRDGHGLDRHEALGLAGLLNSTFFDRYFRISAGNTQVNATQIRNLPLPAHEVTIRIGKAISAGRQDASIDEIISQFLQNH